MKKNIIMVLISCTCGIIFTFFFLNKENIYAKHEYIVYAFQVGSFATYDEAKEKSKDIAHIIIEEDNLYKVYTAMYKDINLINLMVDYYEKNNVNIYLKMLNVDKKYYEALDKYEDLIKKIDDQTLYKEINQSILNLYLESKG